MAVSQNIPPMAKTFRRWAKHAAEGENVSPMGETYRRWRNLSPMAKSYGQRPFSSKPMRHGQGQDPAFVNYFTATLKGRKQRNEDNEQLSLELR